MTTEICFLAYENMELLDLAGPQSAFHEANQVEPSSYKLTTIGFTKDTITCEAGLHVSPTVTVDEVEHCDTLIIPGGKGARSESIRREHLASLEALISRCKRVVSICTGVYLTARTGLPSNAKVATHWAFVEDLKTRYPKLSVDNEQIFVQDGRFWSSAGVTSGIDLSLRLIEIDKGKNTAHQVAKHLVVYLKRSGSQKQFSDILDTQTPKTDRIVVIDNWLKENISKEITTKHIAAVIHLSDRQCHRMILKETGLTPAQYVDKFRMQLASDLLATTDREIKTIANVVGFNSTDGFKRAFQRNFSVSPTIYRKNFLSQN